MQLRLVRGSAVEIARIILTVGADADGLDHLQIEHGAQLKALGFQQAVFGIQNVKMLAQFGPDALDRLPVQIR